MADATRLVETSRRRMLPVAAVGYFALPITPSTYQSKLPILSPPQDFAGRDTYHAGIVGDRAGERIEALADLVGGGDHEGAHIGRHRPAERRDRHHPWPSPSRTIAGLNVPAITLFAVAVMNGPQVKPSPVIQPFGASARAAIDWKPIE